MNFVEWFKDKSHSAGVSQPKAPLRHVPGPISILPHKAEEASCQVSGRGSPNRVSNGPIRCNAEPTSFMPPPDWIPKHQPSCRAFAVNGLASSTVAMSTMQCPFAKLSTAHVQQGGCSVEVNWTPRHPGASRVQKSHLVVCLLQVPSERSFQSFAIHSYLHCLVLAESWVR